MPARKLGRTLLAASFALICVVLFFFHARAQARAELIDFATYWTAAKMLLARATPYDMAAVNNLQAPLAASREGILVMWNPPWTALVFLPLAVFSYPTGAALWKLVNLALMAGSSLFFWRRFGGADNTIGLTLAFAFAPTLVLLQLGQVTGLILAGAALFVFAMEGGHFWLAGAALVPLTFKPHITLLVLIVVTVWSLRSRRFNLLASLAVVVLGCAVIPAAMSPHLYESYVKLVQSVILRYQAFPNLANVIVLVSGMRVLRFLPLAVALGYETQRLLRAETWSWIEELPRLLLLSVTLSFYSNCYDEILAVPALMVAYLRGDRRLFLVLFVLANATIFLYLQHWLPVHSYIFLSWTGTAWLATYWAPRALANHAKRKPPAASTPMAATPT